jgi:hypothetical protein
MQKQHLHFSMSSPPPTWQHQQQTLVSKLLYHLYPLKLHAILTTSELESMLHSSAFFLFPNSDHHHHYQHHKFSLRNSPNPTTCMRIFNQPSLSRIGPRYCNHELRWMIFFGPNPPYSTHYPPLILMTHVKISKNRDIVFNDTKNLMFRELNTP